MGGGRIGLLGIVDFASAIGCAGVGVLLVALIWLIVDFTGIDCPALFFIPLFSDFCFVPSSC